MKHTLKQSVQKGFTLIELMLVVAVIGILAVIAIPQYSNYVATSQIAEGNSLVQGTKTPMITAYSMGACIKNDTAVNLQITTSTVPLSLDLSGKYVASSTLSGTPAAVNANSGTETSTGCVIDVLFKNATPVAGVLQGKVIRFDLKQRPGAFRLVCLKNSSSTATTVNDKFLSSTCE